MFLPVPPRRTPDPPSTAEPRPPEVVVDLSGAEVRFFGIPQWRIEWTQIREVAVDVLDYGDGYAEAFWKLTGGDTEFWVPVEIVMGSDEFNERLFSLPGFDMNAYRQSRAAEAAANPGLFTCWRGVPSAESGEP